MIEALKIDPGRQVARIVGFIADKLADAGYSRAVLGMSGGIDSALVAALCAQALGPENVHGMILPYATSNPSSEAHAKLVIEQLGIESSRFEITPMVAPLVEQDPEMGGRRMGNIMARCRMIVLYDRSEAFRGLVMGTSNRTETLLGYFTLFGDSAAALKPIEHLYKYQVRSLSRFLGIPDEIVNKAPSADLWEGQTDEDDLGFSYDLADQILYLITEMELSEEQVADQGFDPDVVARVNRCMQSSAFKRHAPLSLSPVGKPVQTI